MVSNSVKSFLLGTLLCSLVSLGIGYLEPKSEIRFGYGMLFDYHGQVLHGLNRYHLMVGLKIPNFKLDDYYVPTHEDKDFNFCDKFQGDKATTILHLTCKNVWPTYLTAIDKIQKYREQIDHITTKQLPAIIPNYKPDDEAVEAPNFEDEIQQIREVKSVRNRRFISDLISLGIQGISTIMTHRKQSKLAKGMKHLIKNQKTLNRRIIAVENDMMSLTKATLKELELLRKDLRSTGMYIKHLTRQVRDMEMRMNEQTVRINDNSNAIIFLSGTISVLMAKMERYLALYEQIISELDHLLDALDNLSNGLLSHSVIAPDVLSDLIVHVKEELSEKYTEYELVIDQVHEYYNLPFVSFDYQGGMLGIQIPLFIKLKVQEPLYLYNIRSIPVPYHMNKDLIDEDESEFTYTYVAPSTELLAMSSDTYINLEKTQLEQCIKFGMVYFCEQLLLIKHNSEHTCESAIYHYQNAEIIKDKCNIRYYPYLDPEPAILDAGSHLLLGNLPKPWKLLCRHNDQIPNPIEGNPYVIIDKSDLCQCSISAGTWYIQENIAYCKEEPDTQIKMKFTINMAVMNYKFPDTVKSQGITDVSLYDQPLPYDPLEPKIIVESEEEILDEYVSSVYLDEAMKEVEGKRYATKQDYAIAMNDPTNWFGGDNKWLGFMAICAIITIILVPIVILILRKYFGLNTDIQRINSTVAKFIGLARVLPGANALGNPDTKVKENCTYFQDEDMLIVVAQILMTLIGLYVLYVSVRKLVYYFGMNNVSNIQTKLSPFHFLLFDKTDIFLQVTDQIQSKSHSVYLGTYFGNPEDLETEGQFDEDDVVLETHLIYDYVQIQWNNFAIVLQNLDLQLPTYVQVPLTSKFQIRSLFRTKQAQFRLVAYNASSYKIRAISSFYPMMSTNSEVAQASLPDDTSLVQDALETTTNHTNEMHEVNEMVLEDNETKETIAKERELYEDGFYKDQLNYTICSMFGSNRIKCAKCKRSINRLSLDDIRPMKQTGRCSNCVKY